MVGPFPTCTLTGRCGAGTALFRRSAVRVLLDARQRLRHPGQLASATGSVGSSSRGGVLPTNNIVYINLSDIFATSYPCPLQRRRGVSAGSVLPNLPCTSVRQRQSDQRGLPASRRRPFTFVPGGGLLTTAPRSLGVSNGSFCPTEQLRERSAKKTRRIELSGTCQPAACADSHHTRPRVLSLPAPRLGDHPMVDSSGGPAGPAVERDRLCRRLQQ